MPAFLKIENIGVCPPEGFTVLGVSLADTSTNEGVIGTFGQWIKHGVAVCLRNELSPVVFAGTLKMEFSIRPQTVSDSQASKEFGRVVVKYGGTDQTTGASRSSTEDLGFVLDYGKQDWNEVALALREFVSNAIDRSIREKGDWSRRENRDRGREPGQGEEGPHQGLPAAQCRSSGVLQQPGQMVPAFLRTGVVEQGDPAQEEPQPGRPQGGGDLSPWRPGP